MMLELNYQMQISFDQPVRDHHFVLRLLPRPDSGVVIHQQHLWISGDHDHGRLQDGFANRLITGFLQPAHREFEAQLQARIERVSPPKHELTISPAVFLAQGQLTAFGIEHAQAWLEGIPSVGSLYDLALALNERVHQRMTYAAGSTNVYHTVAELLITPIGVCQDYAHILIALLRHHHIPARYVAGVAQGEGQSHAWVEAWIDNEWQGFDPTHNQRVDAQDPYIAFAVGRDFNDCPLNSGCYTGIARQSMHIQTQLTPS